MEKMDHGGMEEEVCVQGREETPEHNTTVELCSPPLSELPVPPDAQAGDFQPDESNCDVIAQDILVHAKLVLCDGLALWMERGGMQSTLQRATFSWRR